MILTIDIGGTAIKTGVIEQGGPLTELDVYPTNPFAENFSMLERIDMIIEGTLQDYADIEGVAISSAGIIDANTGAVIYANENIPDYKGTQIKQHVETTYNLPCEVENDVNCALLGELTRQEHQQTSSAIMFTIGTGVGGAMYLGNQLFHGNRFSAGEVGYSFIDGQPIERVASTTALVDYVKARVDASVDSETIDGHYIFDQAKAGDALCQEAIEQLVSYLATLIINSVSLINPEVVILGGGIMEQSSYLRPLITKAVASKYTNDLVLKSTHIDFASLGNKAGMVGAAANYFSKKG